MNAWQVCSIVPDEATDLETQKNLLVELDKVTSAQEEMLWRMAISRDAVEFAFPPGAR